MRNVTLFVGRVEHFEPRRQDLARIVVVVEVHVRRLPVRIQLHADQLALAHQELRDLVRRTAPDLRGQVEHLLAAVRIGQFEDDGHDEPAHVAELEHVEVPIVGHGLLEHLALPVGIARQRVVQALQKLPVVVAVLVGDGERIVFDVEVLEVRHPLQPWHHALRLVGEIGARRRLCLVLLTLPGPLHVRVPGIHLQMGDPIDGDVHVVGGEEPAPPEPVEIHPRSLFHGAEQVGGGGPLELPASGVLAEREIEQLTAENGLAQDDQRRGRLGVGIVAELHERFRVGHDGDLLLALHVVDDPARLAAGGGVVLLPLLLGDELQEGVEPLVHPGPLALVRVHHHGEVGVADLVDHHAYQEPSLAPGVGSGAVLLQLGARPVESDHGVLHAPHRAVHRLGHWIRVGERVAGVHLHGVDHRLGGVLRPQGLALLGVERHGHDERVVPVVLAESLGVPDELAGAGPGEVPHVLGREAPGLAGVGAFALVLEGLVRRDDEHRTLRVPGLFKAPALLRAEHVGRIVEDAGGRDHVIRRHGDGHPVVAELQGELAAADELLVVPALVVGIRHHPRIPLGHQEDVVAVLEVLVARAGAHRVLFHELVAPVDAESGRVTAAEGCGEVDAHQGAVDHVGQRLAPGVGHPGDAVAAVEALQVLQTPHLVIGDAVRFRQGAGPRIHRVAAEAVLVELQPEIPQGVGRTVGVGDGFAAGDHPPCFVQRHLDVVVGPLLPVAGGRRPRGVAVHVGGGQLGVELTELVDEIALGLLDGAVGGAEWRCQHSQ